MFLDEQIAAEQRSVVDAIERVYDRGFKDGQTAAGSADAHDGERLDRIRQIIEYVDHRCMAADIVTPTLDEMTQKEISAIYALACRKPEDWVPE